MLAGREWLIEARGCQVAALEDPVRLAQLCERCLRECGLRVLGTPQWHQFAEPKGVTGLYLLAESHLAVHTFPEHALATFNLFSCVPRPVWPWAERLAEALGARDVVVTEVPRG